MKTLMLVVILFVASSTHAQELTTFYGKGVSHNPNSDMAIHSLAWNSGRVFGVPLSTRIVSGEVIGDAAASLVRPGDTSAVRTEAVGGGARPFKFLGMGKEIEITHGRTFCSIGAGAAVAARTTDATQYGALGYTLMACGIRIRGVSISFARFQGTAPNLSDPWTARSYDAPVFQGFQISARFNMTRSH